jgi:hypothetical protein
VRRAMAPVEHFDWRSEAAADPPRWRQGTMGVYEELDARQVRIKAIWDELMRTPRESPRHRVLVEELIEESAAYVAVVNAAHGVDRKPDPSD